MPINIPGNADLNSERVPGMFYNGGGVRNILNLPPNMPSGDAFSLFVEKTGSNYSGVKQTITGHSEKIVYYRIFDLTWSNWIPLATAEPPQEFALPLASGMVNNYKSTYHKNQFGEVAVIAALHHATALPAFVATLPVGYRPASATEFPAVFVTNGSKVAGTITIKTDGQISIVGLTTPTTHLFFNVTFASA